MQETFQPLADDHRPPDLDLALYVDFSAKKPHLRTKPHFRALDHLYYASYGSGDAMVVDQLNRQVLGHFSLATASDLQYWKCTILPILAGIVSASVGVTPVHCACVVKDGRGLLLNGESGAGKSTLAVALSQVGFAYLADDCTYLSRSGSEIRAWGLPIPVKLLPDAVTFFPQLRHVAPQESLNGEMALQVDPNEELGVERCLTCTPEWLVFLERSPQTSPMFRRITSREAAARLAGDLESLPECIADQRRHQSETIDLLVDRNCWVLRHGITPQALAQELAAFCRNESLSQSLKSDLHG